MTWHAAAAFGATGAWLRWSVGWWLPLLLAVVAAHRRSRVAALLLVFVLAGWLGDRAEAGLDPPPAADVDAWVVLTGDPRPSGPVGVRVGALGFAPGLVECARAGCRATRRCAGGGAGPCRRLISARSPRFMDPMAS